MVTVLVVLIPATVLTVAAVAASAARRYALFDVRGTSMRPTFEPDDRLLVRRTRGRTRRPPRRGDAVVLPEPLGPDWTWERGPFDSVRYGSWVVKRIAAVAGDEVPAPVRAAAGGVRVVPEATVVVLGDNPQSSDSRIWGLVPADRVWGVVVRDLGARRPGPAGT